MGLPVSGNTRKGGPMKDLCRKFLKLLLVELEDLGEDLAFFTEMMERRHRSGQITDYVYQENLAVLRNEVMGLADCLRGCADLELMGGKSVAEISAGVKARLHERLKERGYVPALFALLDRRIDRIAAYLSGETAADGTTVGSGVLPGRSHS